ncbi:MAG: recombination mediator RecR [bacterium]|nr:recombination mediator RecR [bacterium]
MTHPESIQKLIESFAKLPTIGRKSAERFVFWLLKQPQAELDNFANNLQNVKKDIQSCDNCGNISNTNPCPICADEKRDRALLCVVSTTRDLILIENTRKFNGRYHVLGGNIDTAKDVTPEKLNLQNLIKRAQAVKYAEIILALSPTFEGEATAMYISNLLKNYNIKITKLARGLPSGADIEYADELTLTNAIQNRR